MEQYSEDGKILIKGPDNVRVYTVREGTEIIGESAFEGNLIIEDIEFPETLKEIRDKSFYRCETLKWINFPKSLCNIGKEAFKDCI